MTFHFVRYLQTALSIGRAALVASALVVPLSGYTASFEENCANRLPPSVIDVQSEPSRVQYDFNKSVRDLSQMKSYHDASAVTLGLTKVELKSEVRWSFNELTDSSGRTCLRPSAKLLITVNPQTVYVAKEFPQGTCAFKEIANHELRHVYANQEHAEKVADFYQVEISRVMGQEILYGRADELHKKLDDTFKSYWMKRISADLQNVHHAHGLIDTPTEYARNDTMCNGEVPRMLQSLGLRKKFVR